MNNMGINTNAFGRLMRMLAQYENAPAAVIREYVSNAVDAIHGMGNGHVDVVLPSSDNRYFTVRDNGCGMSYEFMNTELCNYLTSTKSNDGKSIGSKGIGSKAAFSVSDEFSITSVKDGVKTTCVYHINDDDECGYEISSEDAHGESNGTLVSVLIKDEYSIERMRSSVSSVLCGFDRNTISVSDQDGEDVFIEYFDMPRRVRINDTVSINTGNPYGFSIVQGNVWYDIKGSALYKMLSQYVAYDYESSNDNDNISKIHDIKSALNIRYFYGSGAFNGFVIYLDGNSLTTNPSRESFEATKHNMNVLIDALHTVYDTVSNGKTTLLNILNESMDNEVFRNLDYDDARSVFNAVVNSAHLDSIERNNLKIGGEVFSSRTIPTDEPVLDMHKSKNTKNSTYEVSITSEPNEADGKYHHLLSKAYEDTVSLFISGMDEEDILNEAKKIVRKRKLWASETHAVKEPYNIMRFVFTKNDIRNDIPFWLNKGTDSVFMTAEEYYSVIDAHNERVRKEAAERRRLHKSELEKTVENLTVSVMTFNGRNHRFSNSSLYRLSSIEGLANTVSMDNDMYRLLRTYGDNGSNGSNGDGDTYVALRNGIRTIGLLSYIEDNGSFGYEDVIVVCRKGSKKSMKLIDETVKGTYHDVLDEEVGHAVEPSSVAHSVVDHEYRSLIEAEYKRMACNMVREYNSYHHVLERINADNDSIVDERTKDVIGKMADACGLSYQGASITKDIMKNIHALESIGIFGTTTYHNDQRVEQLENAVDYFKCRYPIINAVGVDTLVENNDDASMIVDYINMCDKARKN